MKKDNLQIGALVMGFLITLIFVITTFCLTFCGENDTTFKPSSSLSQVEELIVDKTTTTETSTDVSTETTTTTVEESTTATPVEEETTAETVTETSQEQTTVTSQESTSASVVTTTETVSSYTTTVETTIPLVTLSTMTLKSVEEIAQEVWQGFWGAGAERKEKLEAAGYNYNEVQKVVDEIGKTMTAPIEETPSGPTMQFVKTFTRGTYYAYGGPRRGGSGRQLIDCSQGSGGIKGSIASRYLYENYGYNYNGKRTMVYLEIEGYSSMNGYYYLDDSNAVGHNNVIDFFYLRNSNCPFQYQGVVKVQCYIVK